MDISTFRTPEVSLSRVRLAMSCFSNLFSREVSIRWLRFCGVTSIR